MQNKNNIFVFIQSPLSFLITPHTSSTDGYTWFRNSVPEIPENIRKTQEANLLAPEIDLSAVFVTTIWRENEETNDATNIGTSGNNIGTSGNNIGTSANNIGTNLSANIGTSSPNIATDHLSENKRIFDRIVKKKVKLRMTEKQITFLFSSNPRYPF